jgi:hypothetical protein
VLNKRRWFTIEPTSGVLARSANLPQVREPQGPLTKIRICRNLSVNGKLKRVIPLPTSLLASLLPSIALFSPDIYIFRGVRQAAVTSTVPPLPCSLPNMKALCRKPHFRSAAVFSFCWRVILTCTVSEQMPGKAGRFQNDIEQALWETDLKNCCIDGKGKDAARRCRLEYLGYLRAIIRSIEITMRAVWALGKALSDLKPQNRISCGFIIQYPFSVFCVDGTKDRELRKSRAPPGKINSTFFVLESVTKTTFSVHEECLEAVCGAAASPKHAVGTVYLEGSYLLQEPDLTSAFARQTCLTFLGLRHAYTLGYRHVWIFSQPVKFKVPIPTPKIAISPRGCVIWARTNTAPISKKPKQSHVLAKMQHFLALVS